jgi:hypothetical protein
MLPGDLAADFNNDGNLDMALCESSGGPDQACAIAFGDGHGGKVMQELLRHSSLRSTLDVYTQAVTPAKHAAEAAVLSLVFSRPR